MAGSSPPRLGCETMALTALVGRARARRQARTKEALRHELDLGAGKRLGLLAALLSRGRRGGHGDASRAEGLPLLDPGVDFLGSDLRTLQLAFGRLQPREG